MSNASAGSARDARYVMAALLCTAVLAGGCIKEPRATTCAEGVYCPAGSRCAARQDVCIFDGCGDGRLEGDEVCDDGNKMDGDGCSADCGSSEICGNEKVDTAVGEVCDLGPENGGPNCSADCRSLMLCGDSTVNPGEDCDPGRETDTCDGDCTVVRQGDGYVNLAAGEECDDGNADNADDCLTTSRWNRCGDGFVDRQEPVTEACDLGARVGSEPALRNGDASCPYGMTSCVGCSSGCDGTYAPVPRYCGNGRVDASFGEVCDHLYQFVCGTCRVDCGAIVTVAPPTGTIAVATTAVADGDSLTIDDGTDEFTIELDPSNDGCQPTASRCVRVSSGATRSEIAALIRNATSGWSLTIAASLDSTDVDLVNTAAGVTGNVLIANTSANGAIFVSGMTGGVGCPLGSRCSSDTDCVSLDCSTRTSTCKAPRT